MDDMFSSAWNLTASADEHLAELDAMLSVIVHQDNTEALVEVDPNTGEQVFKVRANGMIHPRVNVRIFNIATELRAALDHAVYAASVTVGTHPSPTDTAFPFQDDLSGLTREMEKRCRGVPSDIQAVLWNLKPYKAGNEALWRLNKLRNFKDHRRLIVPVVEPVQNRLQVQITRHKGETSAPNLTFPPSQAGAADNEFIFLRLPPGFDAKYDLNLSFEIVFGEVPNLEGYNVVSLLRQSAQAVDDAIRALENKTLEILRERTS